MGNIACNNPAGQRLFSTPEAASSLLNALQKYATTADSAHFVGLAVAQISFNNPVGSSSFELARCLS